MEQPNNTPLMAAVAKLKMASNQYLRTSPGLSRFYMAQSMSLLGTNGKKPKTKEQMVCPFCASILVPGRYTVKMEPKIQMNHKVENLKKIEFEGRTLSPYQQKLLDRHRNETNSLIVHCNTCWMDTKFNGQKREEKKLPKNVITRKLKTPREESDHGFKGPTLTPKMRKKLRKRNRQREKSSVDSGIALDSTSSTSQVTSLSLSSISSMGSIDTSLSSVANKPLSSLPSPFTSTPKLQRPQNLSSLNIKSPSVRSSLFSDSSLGSPEKRNTGSSINPKKGRKNKNKGLTVLQRMLSEQNNQESRKNNSSSLHQFLNAL